MNGGPPWLTLFCKAGQPLPCSSRSTITLVSTVIKACPRMGMPRSHRDQQCRAKTRQAGLAQRPDRRAQQRSAPFTHGPGRGSSPRIHRPSPIHGCRSTHRQDRTGVRRRRPCANCSSAGVLGQSRGSGASALLPAEGLVRPGGWVLDRFEMGEHVGAAEHGGDLLLQLFAEVMAPLHTPVARHKHVQ